MSGTPAQAPAAGRRYAGRSADTRRSEQRERLLNAACDAFATRGYAATSVEHIVAGAHASRSTFYSFFANREECLLAVYRAGAARVAGAVAETAGDAQARGLEPPELIRAEVEATLRTFAADPAMARILLIEMIGASREAERVHAQTRRAAAEIIQAQMERYAFWRERDRNHRRVASRAAMAAVGETVQDLVGAGRLAEWHELVEPLTEFLCRALVDPADMS
jgi:AcrR family transcriptional regulator